MLRAYSFEENRLVSDLYPLDDLKSVTKENFPVWFDLINPAAKDANIVENLLGLSMPTREEMQEIEMSARLYSENGAEFMTITAVVDIESEEPTLTPITFVLKDTTLVTIRYAHPKAFDYILARAQKPHAIPCAVGVQILLGLIEALTDRLADALERVASEIDSISREVFRIRTPRTSKPRNLQNTIEQIGRNGDLLTKLNESLVSIIRLLTYHSIDEQRANGKNKDARSHIQVLSRDAIALRDQTTFLSSKINFLLDATLGFINLEQNQTIKIFSVAAVVFLPPTLIASIYGMNFNTMPELTWTYGYPLALVLMVVSAVLPFWYFKYRGWL